MKLKKLLFVITILSLISCGSNPKSYYKKGEKITIELNEADDGGPNLVGTTTLALAAPELINIGIKGLKSLIKNEQAKYTQSYDQRLRNNNFYKTRPKLNSPANFSYSGFTIVRKVTKSEKIENETASKLKFEFIADSDSNTMMAIEPTYIEINSTKSKLKAKDSTVDLLVNISIKSFWTITKDGIPEFNSKEIASVNFNFKNIELGKSYDKSKEELKGKKSDWFSALPVTVIDNKVKDNGKFIIEVTVTESDDIKKRFEKYSKNLDGSEELIKIVLKDAFNIED